MVIAGIAAVDGSIYRTAAWFSPDGTNWSEPVQVGEDYMWVWRVTWLDSTAYGVGYSSGSASPPPYNILRLYATGDGINYSVVVDSLSIRSSEQGGRPTESTLLFLPDKRCLCLTRREPAAQLGSSRYPYTEWDWIDLGASIGGPNMLRLPDGKIIIAGRRTDEPGARTSLMWLDEENTRLIEFLPLPSGGDNSYPGLVFHDSTLWVSYYSSHEEDTTIYLARVHIPLNHPPVITSPDSVAATEGVPFQYRAVALDPEHSPIDWAIDHLPHWLTAGSDSVYGTPGMGEADTTFRIIAYDNGWPALSDTVTVTVTVNSNTAELIRERDLPTTYKLHQNYSNPFNPATTICYDMPEAAVITIVVYDLVGREVARLVEGHMQAGYHQVVWQGHTVDGRVVPTGLYIAHLTAPGYTRTIKMVMMK